MSDITIALKDNPVELKDADRKLGRAIYALSLAYPQQLEVVVTETPKPKLIKFKGLPPQEKEAPAKGAPPEEAGGKDKPGKK